MWIFFYALWVIYCGFFLQTTQSCFFLHWLSDQLSPIRLTQFMRVGWGSDQHSHFNLHPSVWPIVSERRIGTYSTLACSLLDWEPYCFPFLTVCTHSLPGCPSPHWSLNHWWAFERKKKKKPLQLDWLLRVELLLREEYQWVLWHLAGNYFVQHIHHWFIQMGTMLNVTVTWI